MSYANELGRLCQGVGTDKTNPTKQRVEGTNTFCPIAYHDIPCDCHSDVTYTQVVCKVRPQKEDPNCTHITIRGTILETRPHAPDLWSLSNSKSTVSYPQKMHYLPASTLATFYLGRPLDQPKYTWICIMDIPQEFIDKYNLMWYSHDRWVYFEITNGVYDLKQAGKISATTPGFWCHRWRPVSFVLIIDDFGIKYVSKQHAGHLLAALHHNYNVTTDWTGSKFAGIDFAWNYPARTIRLTMNGYISKVLLKYSHQGPNKPQYVPHACRAITYGTKEQLLPDADSSPPLDGAGVKRIQGIIGSLLYYAWAVDNKLLATLSTLSAQQAHITENTSKAVDQLLDYVATYPSDGVTYQASTMVLAAHSDASFLTESGSRSWAGAHIFLTEDNPIPHPNGPILTLSQIIRFVMALAAEAELAALYLTEREMIPLQQVLEEMGWKQP